MSALVRGDVASSIALNPWTLILFAQAVVLTTAFAAVPETARRWWERNDLRFLQANLALGLTIWIIRLAAGVIPLP